ncbi:MULTISPECIES: DUF6907 domain-containing protein [Streptacidiphilus]|uniref:Uncharacterized protein n=1 Tax=Streptacidiphilus cavernicola TaxID=3342716 RepID=A0ABV6UTV0_9ACTN|nr:hypothetical protein [Streptacidiphilus jeojiense]
MPNEILTEYPPWCGGVHNPRQGWGESQFRATQPVCLDVELQGRAYEIGSVDITQHPNATDPFKREADISLQLADPAIEPDPDDIEAPAAGLVDYAGRLRDLNAKLVQIRADDRAAKAWRT